MKNRILKAATLSLLLATASLPRLTASADSDNPRFAYKHRVFTRAECSMIGDRDGMFVYNCALPGNGYHEVFFSCPLKARVVDCSNNRAVIIDDTDKARSRALGIKQDSLTPRAGLF